MNSRPFKTPTDNAAFIHGRQSPKHLEAIQLLDAFKGERHRAYARKLRAEGLSIDKIADTFRHALAGRSKDLLRLSLNESRDLALELLRP